MKLPTREKCFELMDKYPIDFSFDFDEALINAFKIEKEIFSKLDIEPADLNSLD